MIAEDTTPIELMKLSTMSRVVQARSGAEEHQRDSGGGNTKDESRASGRPAELVLQATGDDLKQGEQRSDTGQDQGREEEHAEEGARRASSR